jgi:hypothetical protein
MNPNCPRRVGFLFPHPCDRLSSEGCPDCRNGILEDPYTHRRDRGDYADFNDYSGRNWVGATHLARSEQSSNFDFTEADGEDLVKPRRRFQDDMMES